MLVTIATALIFVELKGSFSRIWSTLENKFWTEWELRVMILLSLLMQFSLVRLGNQRKHIAKPWTGIAVWSVYLLADWMATVTLSTLLKSKENLNNGQSRTGLNNEGNEGRLEDGIVVFWTPFLLLHLGGPDTITAYSLADNELWLRHLLGLLIQFGTACYVYYRFHSNSPLQFIAIPIFIAGIIKYGERIWVLRSASSKEFQKSVFSKPKTSFDPESRDSRKLEKMEEHLRKIVMIPEAIYLHEAFLSFKLSIPLFSDLTLRFYDKLLDIFINLRNKSMEEAFRLVEVELGFLYDVLYTKRTLLHSLAGVTLRSICLLSSVSALIAFLATIKELSIRTIDVYICYLLLMGAIVLDIYSVISHCFSPWTMIWLSSRKGKLAKLAYWAIASRSVSTKADKGLISIAQHNLINFSIGFKQSRLTTAVKLLDTDNMLLKYRYTTWKDLDLQLKKFIYSHLLEKHKRYANKNYEFKFLSESLLVERGGSILKSRNIQEDLSWSIDKVEFTHSLLVWHIATDLCYFDDLNRYGDSDLLGSSCQISRSLSDYMLYLLVVRSFMLPKGISEVRTRDTCKEAMNFIPKKEKMDSDTGRMGLLNMPVYPPLPGKEENKSVLFDGSNLSQQLQSLVTNSQWDHEEKWEMISQVWVEMLIFAASHCEWKAHVHQLRHGKELLTHVSLLMMHLGLNSHIQIMKFEEPGNPPWNWDALSYLSRYLA